MSDTGGGDGTDLAGGGRFRGGNWGRGGGVGATAKLGNVAAQATEFKTLAKAIDDVTKSLQKLSEKSGSYANTIAKNLEKVSGAMGGASTGVGGSTAASNSYAAQRSTIPTSSGAPGSASPADASPPTSRSGTMATASSWLGSAASSDIAATVAMAPLRFIRDRMQVNRNVVLGASNQLNMAMLRGAGTNGFGGVSQETMLDVLGRNPGGVKGTTQEMIDLMQYASKTGASYGFANGAQGVRGPGFFQGVQQAQALNPGASVQSIMGAIGGQASNTGAQQQSMMMTGGAYSMIGKGGRQKSLTEWADSIMKWLIDLRPGPMRGKAFSYGELMSQYYPGSNIDAWFNANQVSQEMREYWWTYELGKVSGSVSSDQSGNLFQMGPGGAQKNNLASLRLESTNVLTQGEFSLGKKMSGAYGNREQSNRAFNEMIQSFLAAALPQALSSGPLAAIQYMPDMIEDLLFGLLERAPNSAQTLIGGGALAGMFLGGMGDVGDIGDMPGAYGAQGGTTTSGMHPDMKRKVGAMQRANPRVRVTSGLRDTGLQQRLRQKGYKNVSGKASAHTRGMAADLGPPSEYGWIAQNANKFGLKSGKGHGEPWHVGMGDIGDFEDFKGMLSGSGSAETLFDMMSNVLGLLGRGLGADMSSTGPEFDTGLYGRLQQKMRGGISLKTLGGAGLGGGGGAAGTVTLGGGGVGRLTPEQVAQLAYNQGFRGQDLITAVAIAGRESKFDAHAYNGNAATGDQSYGLWQINMKGALGPSRRSALGIASNDDLWIGENNAKAMKMLYDSNSTPFYHWGPYKGKEATYDTDVPAAKAAVQSAGLGDVSEYMTPMGGPTQHGKNVVFVNTFNLQGGAGGGSNGGIDVRRTVTQMADHLEAEMKTRMARSN